jgi:hypothetical protein
MNSYPDLNATTDAPMGSLALPAGTDGVLAQEDGRVQMSFVCIDGVLREVGAIPPDPDRSWAEVDLPVLLLSDATFRFQR